MSGARPREDRCNVKVSWRGIVVLHLASAACSAPLATELNAATLAPESRRICETVTIVSEQDLKDARACDEIAGDLVIRSPSLERIELPRLSRISGLLLSLGSWPLRELSLPALTEVGGEPAHLVEIGFGLSNLKRIALPKLHTVNGSFGIAAMAELRELDISSLEEVTMHFGLINLPKLSRLHHNEQLQADGRFALELLCRLPKDALPDTSSQDPEQVSLRDLSCCLDPQGCNETLCRCESDLMD